MSVFLARNHLSKNRANCLRDWFLSPQGKQVSELFAQILSNYTASSQGETLLQLGTCGDNRWLDLLSYTHKWVATTELPDIHSMPLKTNFLADFDALPFQEERLDTVIAPFTLELFDYKINMLGEIDRILKPMGYAIFWGINPWGLWGLSARMRAHQYFGALPIQLTSAFFVKHTMLSRGYVQSLWKNFYYIPPIKHKALLPSLKFLNTLGKFIWPCPAAFYCLILQKYQENYLSWSSARVDKKIFCHARMQESGMYFKK